MANNIHITHSGESDWQLKRAGGKRASETHNTQAEAIERGKEMARRDKVELFIHNRGGKIRERNTYGHDPRSIKG